MGRDDDWKRISAMAGVDEDGGILPPPPGAKIGISPCKFWKTREYGMTEKEIPEDVMKAAREARIEFADEAMTLPVWKRIDFIIARAIMAERERCAKVIEAWEADLSEGEFIDSGIRRLAARVRRGHP